MDFITTGAPAVPIKINGKGYNVPRFLLPAMREWAAKQVQAQIDLALAQLPDADAKARFMMFFSPPPTDVMTIMQESRSPDGVDFVLRMQLEKAGVPAEERDAMLAFGDPQQLRALAKQVCSADQAGAQLAGDSNDPGAKGNPPSGQPHTSDGSPATTATTSPASPQPTESTPTG